MIILDNGHGHETPGKRSPAGMLAAPGEVALYEYEFNRDIVNRIIQALDQKGIDFYELVPEDWDVSLPDRCARANAVAAKHKGAWLLSVHANAGGGTGWEVFTYTGQNKSDKIAEVFAQEARKALPEFTMRFDTTDGDLDKEAPYYILKHTACPAVLTENLFMDTPKDLAFIMSDAGRQRIADLHVAAIEHVIRENIC